MAEEDTTEAPPIDRPLSRRPRKSDAASGGPAENPEHAAVVAEIVARDRGILDRLAEA